MAAPIRSEPAKRTGPREIPSLLVRKGRLFEPGPDGPVPMHLGEKTEVDPFDAFDRLAPTHRRIYIVDLDGIEHGEPQLDLWQELSREADLWIDGGVRSADQSIDIIVSGARRAVLSTSRLEGPAELKRAWKLSPELAIEIEVVDGKVPGTRSSWGGRSPDEVATEVRSIGPEVVILGPRGQEIDWALVRRIASGGPTYVGGTYARGELERLRAAEARGGIYHVDSAMLEAT